MLRICFHRKNRTLRAAFTGHHFLDAMVLGHKWDESTGSFTGDVDRIRVGSLSDQEVEGIVSYDLTEDESEEDADPRERRGEERVRVGGRENRLALRQRVEEALRSQDLCKARATKMGQADFFRLYAALKLHGIHLIPSRVSSN